MEALEKWACLTYLHSAVNCHLRSNLITHQTKKALGLTPEPFCKIFIFGNRIWNQYKSIKILMQVKVTVRGLVPAHCQAKEPLHGLVTTVLGRAFGCTISSWRNERGCACPVINAWRSLHIAKER
jgi:hypothetical protein